MTPRMGGYVPADHASRHQDGGRDEISIASLSGEAAVMTTHKADLDAHMINLLEQFVVGTYLSYPYPHTTSVTITMTQYRLYAMLFVVARDMTFDRIAIDVNTLESGKDVRLGIYNCNASLKPSSLIKDCVTVDTDSAVLKELALSPSVSLTKGRYFLVAISDAGGTVRYECTLPTVGGLGLSGTFGRAYSGYYLAGDSGDFAALPDPFGASPTLYEYTPKIGLRLESLD